MEQISIYRCFLAVMFSLGIFISKTNAQTNQSMSPSVLLGSIDSAKSIDQLSKTLKLLEILDPYLKKTELFLTGKSEDVVKNGFSKIYYDYAQDYVTLFNTYSKKIEQKGFNMVSFSKKVSPFEIVASPFISFSHDDGLPVFSLSSKDAQKIGIPDQIYDSLVNAVNGVRSDIVNAIDQGAKYEFKVSSQLLPLATALGIIVFPFPNNEEDIENIFHNFTSEFTALNERYDNLFSNH